LERLPKNVREAYAHAAAAITDHLTQITDTTLHLNLTHAANQCTLRADAVYKPTEQTPALNQEGEPDYIKDPYEFLKGHFSRSKSMIDVGKRVLPIIEDLLINKDTATYCPHPAEGRIVPLYHASNNKHFAMKTR
jgi:hypothetical protein